MLTNTKIPVTPKLVGGAIEITLAERIAWLKKYYNNYSILLNSAADDLSESEKEDLLLSLDKSEKMIHRTGKKLENLEYLFITVSSQKQN